MMGSTCWGRKQPPYRVAGPPSASSWERKGSQVRVITGGRIFIYDILLIVRTLKIKGRAQINYTWSGYHREVPSASKKRFQ